MMILALTAEGNFWWLTFLVLLLWGAVFAAIGFTIGWVLWRNRPTDHIITEKENQRLKLELEKLRRGDA